MGPLAHNVHSDSRHNEASDQQFCLSAKDVEPITNLATFASDTANGKTLLLRGSIRSQLLHTHKCGFKASYAIQKIGVDHVDYTLTHFITNIGVPQHHTFVGASVKNRPRP